MTIFMLCALCLALQSGYINKQWDDFQGVKADPHGRLNGAEELGIAIDGAVLLFMDMLTLVVILVVKWVF